MKNIRYKAKAVLQKFMKELDDYSEVYAKMYIRDINERR